MATTAEVESTPRRGAADRSLFLLLLLFVGLALAELAAAGRTLPLFVGDRRDAAFDLWSLQHFCGGILLGALLMRTLLRAAPWRTFLGLALFVALVWEAAELAMESGWFGASISTWKDGFEHWSNRLAGDPLMVSTGALVGRRYAHAWKIVVAPASVWFVVNVASPSSMTIQRLLF